MTRCTTPSASGRYRRFIRELNQYHVVMEVDPRFQQSTDAIQQLYVRSANGTQVPMSTFTHFETENVSLAGESPGSVPGGYDFVQLGSGDFSG